MPGTTVALARPRTPARLVALGATLLALAVVLVAGALPASAHDRLVSSSPADGQTLEAAPETIVLTFSSAPLAAGAAVAVTGPDGSQVPVGDLVVDAATSTVTAPVPADVAGGAYTVVWHVVSGDGHPIEGTFSYTVPAPAAPEPTASPTTEAEPVASPEADETAEESPAPDETSAPAEADDDAPLIVAASVAAAAVVAVAAFVVVRRKIQDNEDLRRNRPEDPQP